MHTKILLESKEGRWILPHGRILWNSKKRGAASRLVFDTPSLIPSLSHGSRLQLAADDIPVFTGYVFSMETDAHKTRITAYDGLRYFLFYDTKVFEGRTASQITEEILRERGFPMGELEDSGYRIPLLVQDNRTLLDMIEEASEITRQATGEEFLFYADAEGKFCFQNRTRRILPFIINSRQNLGEYQISSTIDHDSYNRVKLLQEDKRKNFRSIQELNDPESEKSWGVLQYFKRVDSSLNEVQVTELAKNILKEKNRPQSRILLKRVLGNIQCRAGCSIEMELMGERKLCLIEEATHQIEGDHYEMSLVIQ